jgi:uncharacterized protein YdeI (YjbR/CyaY-like superfamily)
MMGTRNAKVDAYIEKSAAFAQPILNHLRAVVHEACPDCVEEMKWSFPHFTYKGMLASMASFKQHCAFGYWKGSLVVDDGVRSAAAMGQLGRITSLADLPSKATLIRWTKKAAALNDSGVKVKREPKAPKKPLRMPADLSAALRHNKKAAVVFAAFSPSKRRDYIEWIGGAKAGDTRTKRLATAISWIVEGKSRNWKYEKARPR